jgi:hypothetical protein
MRIMTLLTILLLSCGDPSSGETPADARQDGSGGAATGRTFQQLNGIMWFYSTASNLRFTEITSQLDELHAKGIRVLIFYAPYHGDPDHWLGCDPLDFYTTPPQNGSLEDWRGLIAAAHERGMKVTSYFVNIYIDKVSAFFTAAEAQYRSGDRTSREVSAFRWSTTGTEELPYSAAGPSAWVHSETAGAYYWSLWEMAGFDFEHAGARAEIERIEKFWLDTGMDGFMWDAMDANPLFRELAVELPLAYTDNDKWLTFEVTNGANGEEYADFGLTSWFNFEDSDEDNDYTLIAVGSQTADGLETELQRSDYARSRGKTTQAWSVPGLFADEVTMRPQEAALLAGAGILYGAQSYDEYLSWPAAARTAWEKVLVTVNANAALWPDASRDRIPTGDDPKAYAIRRTSKDGAQTAVLVYNFKATPSTVTLDLTGTPIATEQTPTNLYGADAIEPISGTTYAITLPEYGFRILEVARR